MSTMDRYPPSACYHAGEASSYNSNARFYDVSWLVSGMVVKDWESFCPCSLPMPPLVPSTKEQCVGMADSSYIMSCPAPTLERFSSLMPGLLPEHKHIAGSVKSYALRSSYFHPTEEPVCPVPTLWLDVPMPSDGVASANRNADIVEWLASPNCKISRLIVAGPSHLQSSNSEALHYMSSFISAILNALLKSSSQAICHLVFYNCSLSDIALWPLLGELLNSSDFPLRSLACVHLQSCENFDQSLAQILQHPQSKLSELILHGLPPFSSFTPLVRALQNPRSQLRRPSVTACNIGDKEMKEISFLLSSPSCKLTAINLSTNVYTDAGLRHLQEALIKAYSTSQGDYPLEMLSLCGSQIYVRDEEVTKAMTEVLKSPGCALATLDLTGRRLDPRWLTHLSHILKASSHRKKLRSLYLLHALYVNSYCAPIDELIEALKASTHIINIHFPWPTEAHKKIAGDVIRRNARLKSTELAPQEQQLEKPCHVKLFLCGDERVGKTTLRKKLLHRSSVLKSSFRAKLGPRLEEPVTQGMNLSLLHLHDKSTSVVICDLAGQREYNALHTFFMTSTNEDIFVVVCKHIECEQSLFEERLQYWLRFIVSHRTQCDPKPMVILVVNFFKYEMDTNQMSWHAEKATEETRKKFSAVLDFGQSPAINVFGVNLSSVRESGCTDPVLTAVEAVSLKLIQRKPWVPIICKDIASAIDRDQKRLGKIPSKTAAPMMTVQELLEKYERRIRKQAASHQGFTARPPSDVDFEQALSELHKIGKVVYFRNDAAKDCSLDKQLVILDPAWFYETLVGSLVKPRSVQDMSSARAVWTNAEIQLMFNKEKICQKEYIDHIIKYLENLELFFPTNTSDGKQQLIFPFLDSAASQETRFNIWIQKGPEGYSFFGRRLDCKEKETSLIPFGVFVRLQAQLHRVYGSNRQYSVGYGWIEFCTEDKIEVFIRIEGVSSSRQEGRHWIDTMVRFPARLPELQETAASIICTVNDSVFGICRGLDRGLCAGVDLEEFVLLEASSNTDARLLSEVKEKVHSQVLTTRDQSRAGSLKNAELLMPREWREFFEEMEAAIQELWEKFPDLPDLEEICSEAVHQISALQQDLTKSNEILAKIDEISASMYSSLCEQQLRRPQSAGAVAPWEEGNGDALPLGAYLVDEQGKFRPKLKAMVNARGARLQLMCESFHGCHEVRGQKGAAITLGSPDRWLAKCAPVLATTLKVVWRAAMMAASLSFSSPVANLFPLLLKSLGLDELLKKTIKSSIPQYHKVEVPQLVSSYLEGIPNVQDNLLHAQASTGLPSEHLLREFYRYALEGHERDVDMERDFCLHHVYFPDKRRSLWVCREHISGGKKQRPFNPFQDLAFTS